MSFNYLFYPFALSLIFCLVLARLAPWLALMDKPDARKQHGRAVPVVGGIAIMGAYILALKLRGIGGNLFEAMLPVALVLVVGVIDDARPVPARVKLIAQCVAAWLLLRVTGFTLAQVPLPGLDGGVPLGPLDTAVTVFVIVGVVNALNLSDGADGLAGGHVMIALTVFLVAAVSAGRTTDVLLIVGLMSSVLGFLAVNARHPMLDRAHVFMGDAGALALGTLLCWFAIHLSRGPNPAMPPVLLLYAVALPLLDMATVSVRRLMQGVSPMRPDRTHLHHILCLKGLSVELSVPLLWALNAAIATLGLLLWRGGASQGVLLLVWVLVLAGKMVWMRVWEEVEPPVPSISNEAER
ncbi:undecaprenyl/decaprenyl-phosphate alpha-N-acetylglucosaminyl 1-phosphate transferase [Niveibacterium sp. 24ML]|uniref:MraY family glycosyltransferase n=1 Tax=Niveibacterium sp. 24ML TaxID=2985512 RepID=UPI002271C8A0|nr:MraY family glycosyltransferase [Niveibacterium sp. 24ML]MCX9154893.1 undecaprenyl/decaprenyl-phosphate alpha-N-acetylglucosaminyl 1-phosphate transferase [Niveibacterium sp. 24ML]